MEVEMERMKKEANEYRAAIEARLNPVQVKKEFEQEQKINQLKSSMQTQLMWSPELMGR